MKHPARERRSCDSLVPRGRAGAAAGGIGVLVAFLAAAGTGLGPPGEESGTLVVVKNAVGDDGRFDFTSTSLGAFTLATTDGTASITFPDVEPGTHDLAEVPAEGWTLVRSSCSDGSEPDAIGLDPGESVTCTFTNTSTHLAFIPASLDNWVTVVETDGSDGAFDILATIAVGQSPEAVIVHPADGTVYVANEIDGTVSVIDPRTLAVEATVAVGGCPAGLEVHPDGSLVFAADSIDDTISVFDTGTNAVLDVWPLDDDPDQQLFPEALAIHPDGTRLYVTLHVANEVAVVETATGAVVERIPVGKGPRGAAVRGTEPSSTSPAPAAAAPSPTQFQ